MMTVLSCFAHVTFCLEMIVWCISQTLSFVSIDEIDKIVMAGDESTDDRDVVEDKSLSVVNKHLSLASQHKQVSWDQYKL